jgi:hypothetical protein
VETAKLAGAKAMLSTSYYREQAELYLQMAIGSADPEHAKQYEAQACLFLNLADQASDQRPDLNTLLDGFNAQQLRKA